MNNQSVKHVGGGFNPKQIEKAKVTQKKPKYMIKQTIEERRDSLKENMRKLIQRESPEKKMSVINSLSSALNPNHMRVKK